MARPAFFIFAALALVACVGDSNSSNDAGGDVTVTDAAPDASSPDAPVGPCVFGTSHIDDGCKFGTVNLQRRTSTMRIRIDFEISPRAKRALKIAAAGAVVLGASVAIAGVPNTFKSGDVLSAQTMNDNFTSLDQRLAKLESFENKLTSDGGYSTGATYCGATSATPGDLSNLSTSGTGYAKAKAACQQVCASSSTAHMCTGSELSRSVSLGISASAGWFSSGSYNTFIGDDFECGGWTATKWANASTSGDYWFPGFPSVKDCTTNAPVLCCD